MCQIEGARDSYGAVHGQRQNLLPVPLSELIPEIARRGKGVIMTMGKGGVGKTTVAAAIATGVAQSFYAAGSHDPVLAKRGALEVRFTFVS
jgi:Mrp family chromosome partitioning ATPase